MRRPLLLPVLLIANVGNATAQQNDSFGEKLQPVRVAAGSLERQRVKFRNLPPVTDLNSVQSLGRDLICGRYDGANQSQETLVTMPARLEVAEKPAGFLSDEYVKTVAIKGLWGSAVPFQFQASADRLGLFDGRYMRMVLAWTISDYNVNKTAIELRLNEADSSLFIRTILPNESTGKDDGVMYSCRVTPTG